MKLEKSSFFTVKNNLIWVCDDKHKEKMIDILLLLDLKPSPIFLSLVLFLLSEIEIQKSF